MFAYFYYLTKVSTWFANARRRLKKENKMTWSPKTGSAEPRPKVPDLAHPEGEDEDEYVEVDGVDDECSDDDDDDDGGGGGGGGGEEEEDEEAANEKVYEVACQKRSRMDDNDEHQKTFGDEEENRPRPSTNNQNHNRPYLDPYNWSDGETKLRSITTHHSFDTQSSPHPLLPHYPTVAAAYNPCPYYQNNNNSNNDNHNNNPPLIYYHQHIPFEH